jgi:hypothetical protein
MPEAAKSKIAGLFLDYHLRFQIYYHHAQKHTQQAALPPDSVIQHPPPPRGRFSAGRIQKNHKHHCIRREAQHIYHNNSDFSNNRHSRKHGASYKYMSYEAVPKLQFLGRQAKLVQQLMKTAVLQTIGRKTARACYKITDFGTGSYKYVFILIHFIKKNTFQSSAGFRRRR